MFENEIKNISPIKRYKSGVTYQISLAIVVGSCLDLQKIFSLDSNITYFNHETTTMCSRRPNRSAEVSLDFGIFSLHFILIGK